MKKLLCLSAGFVIYTASTAQVTLTSANFSTYAQPLENQRLGTTNDALFNTVAAGSSVYYFNSARTKYMAYNGGGYVHFGDITTMYLNNKTVLHSGNYNTYSPTLTGLGASGSWAINVTGTAAGETLQTITDRSNVTTKTIIGRNYEKWLDMQDPAGTSMFSIKRNINGVEFNTYSGGPSPLLLNPNGNVGIGTSNPGTYKLAVEGTIGARKIKVTQETPWADYVFDSSYQLASLLQVEKYIQENKHLPEVPSAAEIKKEGIDVGDNQVLLLKKIEELTLYIIQQNKRMEVIEKELKELKASK